jgi:hypothetical protein
MNNRNKGTKRSQRQKSVAKPETSSPPSAPLSAGTLAPDFALKSTPDQTE